MKFKYLLKYWSQLFLLASIIYFFRDNLFSGKIFVPFGLGLGDYNLGTIPYLSYLAAALKQGHIPLWDPTTFTGFPFVGNGPSFQPLLVLLSAFLPLWLVLNLYLFLTFLIMALSTFYFTKSLKLSNEAALIASLSFVFASGVITRIIHLGNLTAFAYLPLILLLIQKFFEKRNPLILILISFVMAGQLLYFAPHPFLITSLVYIAFFVFKIFHSEKPRAVAGILALFFIYLFTFLLGAIELLPSWRAYSLFVRGSGISLTQAKEFPFHPGELTYFFRHSPIGNPSLGNYDSPYPDPGIFWENTAYIGLLGLALAIFAFFFLFRTRKEVLFFGLVLVGSVILALGKFTPFFFLLTIPPFSFFRIPGRFLLVSMLSLSILAAFGFDGLTQKYKEKRFLLGFIAAIVIIIDLFRFALTYNATYDAQKWLAPPKTAQFLKNDPSFFRIYSLGDYESYYYVYRRFRGWQKTAEPYYNLREGLAPGLNIIYGLNQAGAKLGTEDLVYWQEFLIKNLNMDIAQNSIQPTPLALRMLRLKGVKYVISPFPVKDDNFILRQKIDLDLDQYDYFIYELKDPQPHAFIVHQAKSFESSQEFWKEFTAENFDPTRTLLVKGQELNLAPQVQKEGDKIEVVSYRAEKVEIRAKVNSPGFLVLTDTYFPDWEATVDGQSVKIYKADLLFRAVRVEPGEHDIIFIYKPKFFYYGAVITFTTLLISLSAMIYFLVRRRFRLSGHNN